MARQAAQAQAALVAGEKAAWESSHGTTARLKAADEARDRGDLRTAVRLYMRLARSRPPDASTRTAQRRLTKLADEASKKLEEIDHALLKSADQPSPSDLFAKRGDPQVDRRVAAWTDTVRAASELYDQLVDDYEGVPNVGSKLKAHVAHQRALPSVAVVLNEPEAKTLLETGKQHEADGHQCCAYWVYRQAARLAPAPSAREAQQRFDELEQVPNMKAMAEACREMQHCHQLYARAERVLSERPDRARELFVEVVRRAPAESDVSKAAQRHLDETPQ
jgi:hypothetical protein